MGRVASTCVIVAGPLSARVVTYRTGSPAVTGWGALEMDAVTAGAPAPALAAAGAKTTAATIRIKSNMTGRRRRTPRMLFKGRLNPQGVMARPSLTDSVGDRRRRRCVIVYAWSGRWDTSDLPLLSRLRRRFDPSPCRQL